MNMIAVINAHMIGVDTVPGEHVAWSTPDVMSEAVFAALVDQSAAEYAQANPHMIVWYL